jgi:hypothetical protein
LRQVLIDKYNLNDNPQTIEDHKRNCHILIEWLSQNLKTEVDLKRDAHWTPQFYRRTIIRDLRLKVLLLENLQPQLGLLLKDVVPNIDAAFEKEFERNKSDYKVSKQKILDKNLTLKIDEVYADDRRIYNKARRRWKLVDFETATNKDVPRLWD